MKSKNQRIFEAQKRQKEIAQKNAKMGVTRCGNVKTSFARCTSEYLEGHGFFKKDSDRKPSKDAWCKKTLDKNVTVIDVRKK
jgi:hypothetical protein